MTIPCKNAVSCLGRPVPAMNNNNKNNFAMTTLRCVGDGFIFRVMFCTTINNPAIADGNGTSSPHMMTKRCMLLIARSNLFHLMAGPASFVHVHELSVSCNPPTSQPLKLTLLWNSSASSWFYYSTIVLFGQTAIIFPGFQVTRIML